MGQDRDAKRERDRRHDAKRGTARQRLYDDKWKKARDIFITEHPLCAMHLKAGKVVKAYVVDHIVPHKQNEELFWDVSNWQSLCFPCHNRTKQGEERGRPAIGLDGWQVTRRREDD